MEKPDGYQHNTYQCFLAAKLYTCNKKWSLLKLAPGEGKTFTIILLARYIYSKSEAEAFVMISQNDALVAQF